MKLRNITILALALAWTSATVAAFAAESSSYTIDSFHLGIAGGNGTSTSYLSRSTLTYEQGGNRNASTEGYLVNSGWFNVSLDISPDTSAPVISLESPENDSERIVNSTVTFHFNVSDDNTIRNCSLILNYDTLASTSTSITKDTAAQSISATLPANAYVWNINCTDNGNNMGTSGTRAIRVSAAPKAEAGAGGGGGGSGGEEQRAGFEVVPDSIRTEVEEGDEKDINLKITNTGEVKLLLKVDHNLGEYLKIKEGTIPLSAGGSTEVKVRIIGEEPAIKVGRIELEDETMAISKVIPVVIEVSSKNALFDVKMETLGEGTKVIEGMDFNTLITIIKMLPGELTDVTLEYSVQDYSGQVLYREVETMAVDKQKSFSKTIKANELKPGKYVAGVMLRHPLTFAASSTDFEVVKKELPIEKELKGKTGYIIAGTALLLLLMFILIIKSVIMGRVTYEKYEKEARKEKKP